MDHGMIPLIDHAILFQNTAVNDLAMLAVVLVGFDVLELIEHTPGGAIAHLAVGILLHRIHHGIGITGFLGGGVTPIGPGTLKAAQPFDIRCHAPMLVSEMWYQYFSTSS